jgi:hypothetical protein
MLVIGIGIGGRASEQPAPAAAPMTAQQPVVVDSSWPTTTPDVEWEFNEMSEGYELVPTSAVYGPFTADGQRRAGFQQSPTGAVVAAMQLLFRGMSHREQAESHYVDGDEKDAFLAQFDVTPHVQAYPLGFRVDDYSDDAATVTIRIGVGRSYKTQAVQADLVWIDDDWRVKVPTETAPFFLTWPVESGAGFIAWNATSPG